MQDYSSTEKKYIVFSQYTDENGEVITIQDNGIYAYGVDKIEDAFALSIDGDLEEVEVKQSCCMDGDCYEIMLKRNGLKIAYIQKENNDFFSKIEFINKRKKRILDSVQLPFAIIISFVDDILGHEQRDIFVPRTLEEMFLLVRSKMCKEIYYFEGYKKLIVCDTEIIEDNDVYDFKVYSKETKEEIVSIKLGMMNKKMRHIFKVSFESLDKL